MGLVNKEGSIELYPTIAGDTISFRELRKNAEIINDIPFISLEDVVRIKEFYGREKDKFDIERIKNYLKQNKI